MSDILIVSTRYAARLRNLFLSAGAALVMAMGFAGTVQAENATNPDVFEPPAIVIDAELAPVQPVSYVRYVAHDQDMLAIDATSGSIRAVFPAPSRPFDGADSTLAALTAGSVPVPTLGIFILAAVFTGLVGAIFLRRSPLAA